MGSAVRKLFNLGLLAAGLAFVGAIIAAGVRSSDRDAEVRLVAKQANELFEAFESFHRRNGEYPAAYTGAPFDLTTFDPLHRRGDYRGSIATRLRDGQADAYDSPDDEGLNQEFWLEMTLAGDPSVRLLVADSDDAPLAGGSRVRGAFILRDGELEPL